LPEKIRLAKQYVREQSLWLDFKIILLTLWSLLGDRLPGRSRPAPQAIVETAIHFNNNPERQMSDGKST
jgi:hypothetical protein